jgi:hypothetical protein
MEPTPLAMMGAILAQHDSKTDARPAVTALAELMIANHFRIPRMLSPSRSIERYCTNRCRSHDSSSEKRS